MNLYLSKYILTTIAHFTQFLADSNIFFIGCWRNDIFIYVKKFAENGNLLGKIRPNSLYCRNAEKAFGYHGTIVLSSDSSNFRGMYVIKVMLEKLANPYLYIYCLYFVLQNLRYIISQIGVLCSQFLSCFI